MSNMDAFMSLFAPVATDHDAGPVTDVPREGRVLGLDLGSRRVGVAASDSAQVLAVGVETLQLTADLPQDRLSLAALAIEYAAVGVIIGLPLSLDGGVGRAAVAALVEIDALRSVLGLPVVSVDERLSTVAATSALRAGGRKGRQQRTVVDRTAATVILQSWLDGRRSRPDDEAVGG